VVPGALHGQVILEPLAVGMRLMDQETQFVNPKFWLSRAEVWCGAPPSLRNANS